MNIKQIARLADVSITTVSRVINNTSYVSQSVRERVEKVIAETGYRPSSLAKEMQTNKTNTIGIILSVEALNLSTLGLTINAITDILKLKNYNLMLANTRFNIEEEINYLKTFQEKRVDGILLFASRFTDTYNTFLKTYPVPIVMIGQKNEFLDIPYVLHDNYHAAICATEFLINNGHKQIGFIGSPEFDEAAGGERYRGFETAMKQKNLEINNQFISSGNFSIESGYTAMETIHKQSKVLPTALFIATDYMALGAIHYLNTHNIHVPDDISIVGFDDAEVSAVYNPPLTTIHTDNIAVGRQAAHMLIDILEKKPLEIKKQVIVNYELRERKSVKNLLS